MKISILHPSRSRPEMAYETACKWLQSRDGDISYNLVIDEDDPELQGYKNMFGFGFPVNIIVSNNKTAIQAINYGASVTEWDLCIVVSDDFDPCEHWDTLLISVLEGKDDFCVKIDDGAQGFIMTFPVMDRTYYNRFGYIYNPDYLHMFADTEMSCVAWMLDKYITLPIKFKHNHYSYGGMVKDAVNAKNDATWEQGKEVFKRRYNENFGIVPVKELPAYSGISKYMLTI